MAKVLTDASESFEKMKQEMEAMKILSKKELKVTQDAIKQVESEVRNTQGVSGGGWTAGNSY